MGKGVFQPVAKHMIRDTEFWRGEFTGGAGAVALVKFKKFCTVTYVSAGLYQVNLWSDPANTVALKGYHLKNLNVIPLIPSGSTVGGWNWQLATNAVNTAGTFQIQTGQQSWAATDVIGVVKLAFELSTEAPV